jgi:hypothetical protein
MAAVVIAITFWIVGALFWPNATAVATTLVYVGGYALALRLTWWLLRPRTTL